MFHSRTHFERVFELWGLYVCLGGQADLLEVDAFESNLIDLPRLERLILDQARWELAQDW